MKVGVFIRISYDDIPQSRIAGFIKTCKKSLMRQWYKDFDTWIITSGCKWLGVNAAAPNIENDRIIIQAAEGLDCRCCALADVPFSEYNIQARIDCDDIASDGWIMKCVMEYKAMETSELLLSFAPYRYDGSEMHGGTDEWNANHPSMFVALLQKQPTKSILHIGEHGKMHTQTEAVKHIPEGYCIWNFSEGGNYSIGKFTPRDKYKTEMKGLVHE